MSVAIATIIFCSAFSDFPPENPDSRHYGHAEYIAYLKRYAGHFRLLDQIEFDGSHVRARNAGSED